MRLDEFVNQKVINELTIPDTFKGAVERLKSAGYNSLGSGYYGQVFEKPGADYVLKVFSNRDKAYTNFVNIARQNQDNPHFPKIKGSIVKVTDAYSAVRTEKLANYSGEYASVLEEYLETGSLEHNNPDVKSKLEKVFQEQPGLKDALDVIHSSLIKTGQHENDFHMDNMMSRGNTIVIIDPVS